MREAIILVGGQGTRLKAVTGDVPKPLVEVSGRPFLFRLLDNLKANLFDRVVLATGYRSDFFAEFVSNYSVSGMEILFSPEEISLGTGGALKKASKLVSTDSFFALNGDTFCDVNFSEFIEFCTTKSASLALVGVDVLDVGRYGCLSVNEAGEVLSVGEKSHVGPGVINSGVYYIDKALIQSIDKDVFSFEREVLELRSADVKCFRSSGYFIDIGVPEDYYKATKYFSS